MTIPYIEFSLRLYSCVNDCTALQDELKKHLIKLLNPEFNSDIKIEIIESTGLEK